MKVCDDCTNAYLGVYGVYCIQYKEVIQNERVAEKCPDYDPFVEPVAPKLAVVNSHPSRRPTLESLCLDYLKDAKYTLWGQSFEIKTEPGRKEAALWFASQISAVLDKMENT